MRASSVSTVVPIAIAIGAVLPGSSCLGRRPTAIVDSGSAGIGGGAGGESGVGGGGVGGAVAVVDGGPDKNGVHLLDCSFPTSAVCTTPGGVVFALDPLDTAQNLGRSTTRDAGGYPTLTWDATDGSPSNGALKITATFDAYGQYVNLLANLPTALDLSGRRVGARIRLVSEIPAGAFVPFAQLHVTTGATFGYAFSSSTDLPATGAWTDLSLELGTATANLYTPSMVTQVGVQIYAPSQASDASAALPSPSTLVIELDTITD